MLWLIAIVVFLFFVIPFIVKMAILAWAFMTFAPDFVEDVKNLLLQILNI